MRKSKILEALVLVGLYPGDEFRIAGNDTVYYIDENFGIFTKNDDVISNEKLATVLSNPTLITKSHTISQKEKEILKALYMLGFRYIAKDMGLTPCVYSSLPYKKDYEWDSDELWLNFGYIPYFNKEIDFRFIKWEDKKPFDIKAFLEGEGYEN